MENLLQWSVATYLIAMVGNTYNNIVITIKILLHEL